MANLEEKADGITYPKEEGAAFVDKDSDLDPAVNTDNSQIHPTSTTSKELKEEEDEAAKKENKNGIQNLKSSLLISGAVIAVVGAIFAVVKNIKKA